jgi:uncharacterized protein (DUF697 family)
MREKSKTDCGDGQQPEVSFYSVNDELREIKASKIVNRHMLLAMVSGFIPVPLLDSAAASGVQLKMLAGLSKYYGVPFFKNIGKSTIATLVGFTTATGLRGSFITRYIKMLPGVGFLGGISMSIYAGALTYAIGKLFIQHFESGGTLLTFKPYKVKKFFSKLYKEGQQVAANINLEDASPAKQE